MFWVLTPTDEPVLVHQQRHIKGSPTFGMWPRVASLATRKRTQQNAVMKLWLDCFETILPWTPKVRRVQEATRKLVSSSIFHSQKHCNRAIPSSIPNFPPKSSQIGQETPRSNSRVSELWGRHWVPGAASYGFSLHVFRWSAATTKHPIAVILCKSNPQFRDACWTLLMSIRQIPQCYGIWYQLLDKP